jgi:hypothetical protein
MSEIWPGSAGDEKNVRLWAAGESVSRHDSQAVHIADGIERFPDEMKVQFLEPSQNLVRPGQIELGHPQIEQHHNLHGLPSIGPSAQILFQPQGSVGT